MSGPIHFEPEPGARPGAPPMQVPKGALILAAALIAVVFALAISARVFGFGAFREDAGSVRVVQQRALKFSDVQGGGIRVLDATTNTVAAELPPGTHALVMTHDHAEDAALCDAALRNEQLATIGLIGSRAKWARFRRKLAEDGNSEEAIARITTPIGLTELTGKEPATIAVSVAAWLLQLFTAERRPTPAHREAKA